jgi:hypothetical protein
MRRNIIKGIVILFCLNGFQESAAEGLHPCGLKYSDPRRNQNLVEVHSLPLKGGVLLPLVVDLSSQMPPVGDQGSQGSCVGWAVGYYHKTHTEWVEHHWDITLPQNQCSPAFLYHLINGGGDNGSYYDDAMKILVDNGITSMSQMPYSQSDFSTWPSEASFETALPNRGAIGNFVDISTNAGLDVIKTQLSNGFTAVMGISVYSNFDNIQNYNYTYCVADLAGSNRGGHAVTFVGYNDTVHTHDGVGAFKMVNSWGTGWGLSGYWYMSYQAVMNATLSQQSAYYITDRIAYIPKLIARTQLTHAARTNIGIQFGFGPTGTPRGAKDFFNLYMTTQANQPFPGSKMVFDLSDNMASLGPDSMIFERCIDKVSDGLAGTINSFSAEIAGGPSKASTAPPVAIADYNVAVYATLQLQTIIAITNAAQLDSVRYYCGIANSGRCFKLMNDIDLTTWLSPGNPGYNNGAFWLPIGDLGNRFFGKLDGNNRKIVGLKINRTGTGSECIGLFGCLGAKGKLQNIGVEIKNGDTVKGWADVGGLVGYNFSGTVSNSFAIGAVSGNYMVGGLVGINNSGTVSNSYATGTVRGVCYCIGGLVGENYEATVSNSYATGAVSGNSHVGGLAGYNVGTVSNSYATGAVSGSSYVGGLLGFTHHASVTNTYAVGAVSGISYVGGLIGKDSSGTVSSSYWDKQTTGQDTSSGSDPAFGKTTAEMKTQSTFVDWDFVSTWAINTAMNRGYSYLQWQLPTDLIGAWAGQGTYSRNSNNGAWVKLGSPADLITAGDLDGDGTDDLIGIWPSQGGVWVKYSQTAAWAKLSSTARHITAGDMNGDGRVDLVGTWDGQGTYYRNSITGAWVKLGSPATLVTANDLDGDNTDDLIGIWPSQGGVWIKYSLDGSWAKLSSTAVDIATGDMNGDGRTDLVGTWDGQGTYYRNSVTGTWVKLDSPATQVTAGDLDGDGTDDLIGIWPAQQGVWVKYSSSGAWEKLSSTAVDITTGKVRGTGAATAIENGSGPMLTNNGADESALGPGGAAFKPVVGANCILR